MIRVTFPIDVPARCSPDREDQIDVVASVDLKARTATIHGGSVKRAGTVFPAYPLSVAELELEGLKLEDLRTIAIEEASQSAEACAACSGAEAEQPGSLCVACVAEGELPASYAMAVAAALLKLVGPGDARDKAQTLFNDAKARAAKEAPEASEAAE